MAEPRRVAGVLRDFNAALRTEDYDTAWGMLEQFTNEQEDHSFVDVVHDRSEIYDCAEVKYGAHAQVTLYARMEGSSEVPWEWSSRVLKREVRNESKVLLKLHLSEGQRMHYEPVSKGGAKTRNGWYLSKGELVEVRVSVWFAGGHLMCAMWRRRWAGEGARRCGDGAVRQLARAAVGGYCRGGFAYLADGQRFAEAVGVAARLP
jgi:hypothetical protein